jgi:hypothetical protein
LRSDGIENKRRPSEATMGEQLWDHWRRGQSLRLVARSVGSPRSTVIAHLSKFGGIRPVPPRRSDRHLTAIEREEVSRGIAAGLSLRAIARQIERPPSSVVREVSRNGGRKAYRAAAADDAAWQRARRPKPTVLASRPELLEQVGTRLERDWSPEQILASLRRDFPHDPRMWISHETIYRSI